METTNYDFTLFIENVPELTDELIDTLYEGGCDDALLCHGNGEIEIEFARESESFENAVRSAIEDIERIGLKVRRVQTDAFKFLEDLNRQLVG